MSVLYLQKMFSTYSWMGLYEQRKKFRMSALQEGDDVTSIIFDFFHSKFEINQLSFLIM